MGLFDFFTGGGTSRASNLANQRADAALSNTISIAGQGRDQSMAVQDSSIGRVLGALNSGYMGARQDYDNAKGLFQPYADQGLKGLNLYSDAIGANGQTGYDNAVGSYRQSPGYTNQVNEATDAVARKMSSLGALGSGNTIEAVRGRAQDIADRDYQGWLGNLNNLSQLGYSATGQIAGLTKGQGDLSMAYGQNVGGALDTDAARRIGAINNFTSTAAKGIANNTNAVTQSLLAKGRAQDAGSGNIWGALLGGANAITGAAGRAGGFSNLFR